MAGFDGLIYTVVLYGTLALAVWAFVDAIIRQHEIVIKSIGERLKGTPGIAGATEVGKGEIVLVIDRPQVVSAKHDTSGPDLADGAAILTRSGK